MMLAMAGCSGRPLDLQEVASVKAAIIQDESEPNNRPETANDVVEPSEVHGVIVDGDRDCYKTSLALSVINGAVAMTRYGDVTCLDGVGEYELTAK